MRTQAIEKLLMDLVDAIEAQHDERVKKYCNQAYILVNRSDNKSASVVREIMSGG